MKECSKCKVLKPRSEFSKNRGCKDGLAGQCKACSAAATREYQKRNREANAGKEIDLTGTKKCSMCKVLKQRSEFSKDRSCKDGLRGQCKACKKAANRERRKKNREVNAGREIDLTGTKRCSDCKEEKPRSDFYKNRSSKDGLEDQCKECRAERHAKGQRKKYGDDWIPYQSCGFKPQEPGAFYVVKVRNKNTLVESLKIGITNSDAESRFPSNDKRYELLEIHLEIKRPGHKCLAIEKAFLTEASRLGMRARSVATGKELEQLEESIGLADVLLMLTDLPTFVAVATGAAR